MPRRKDLVPARPRERPYKARERKKRFLLYCEGEVTERGYFRDFASFLRSSLIEIRVANEWRKDPKKLVELAKNQRNSANREAKAVGDDSLRYDEVWCVFDCDDRPQFYEAVDQALGAKLGLAVSNPCFELWILLHFQDQYSSITTKRAHDAIERHVPGYVKHIAFSKLEGKGREVVRRAEKMESIARENAKWVDNPTTSVWQLIKKLCEDSDISIADI